MSRLPILRLPAACLILLAMAGPCRAIMVYGDFGDLGADGQTHVGRFTGAPTGPLAASGWQYEFAWGSGAATAIAPNAFLTAAHLGGSVGQTFQFIQNGVAATFTTTGVSYDQGSDLALWTVDRAFSTYAPIYTGTSEVGAAMVVYGRGTERGEAIVGPSGSIQGYRWGAQDGVMSWGQNTVSGTANFSTPRNDFLTFRFGASAGAASATLSAGDSGGGLFIQDPLDGIWKLAGVNYGVDGMYADRNGASIGPAALFDQRGYSVGGVYLDPRSFPTPRSQFAYATRVSTKLDFLSGVIPTDNPIAAVPEPGAGLMAAIGLGLVAGSRRIVARHRPA